MTVDLGECQLQVISLQVISLQVISRVSQRPHTQSGGGGEHWVSMNVKTLLIVKD